MHNRGFMLMEILVVLGVVAILGLSFSHYRFSVDNRLSQAAFIGQYETAKSIAKYGQLLKTQGFSNQNWLTPGQISEQTKENKENPQWHVFAQKISRIIDDTEHANDFEISFAGDQATVRFKLADEIDLTGYPLQKKTVNDQKYAIVSTPASPPQGRLSAIYNQLMQESP